MSNDRMNVSAAAPVPQVTPVAPRAQVAAAATAQAVEPKQPKAQAPTADTIKAVAQRLESYLKSVNRALEFRVDSGSGKTVVTVRDSETGDVIRQIPNEEVVRLAQMAEDQTIVLVNERV